ncbi:hypothetical protein EWM64_g6730 [Hericium alpestre]|uniref:Uncharacterized protein n=1 Tax=Hericium alpestre TaxID=135208 RepID=A0A4Y9ZR74_9AGAM|nr:hypothetical protein EWM64_g6730 [Hericium alpestre]
MSAGARQSALDALRMDEDVIVIEKSRWFKNLHSSIHHAATRKNFEDYLYGPLMEIFGTYAKTCGHEDLEVTVIPQGCFELRMDSCKRVARNLSDFLVAIHSTANSGSPGDPQYGKSRLGGWVEGKPWVQSSKNPKKKEAADAITKPGTGGGKDIAEEVGDIPVEGEHIAEDVNIDEVNIKEGGEEVDAGEDPALSTGGPSIEDASALVLDSEEAARRLAEDLPQLCRQAYFAFDHFDQDVIYVFITPTASEAAAPVGELRFDLRSGKGHPTTSAPSLEPVAENEEIETPEPALEQLDRVDAASSDVDDSPLNQRLQPKLALSGHAQQAVDASATSGIPGAAGPSTKDTHSLAGNTRAPAFKDLASGVNSKDKFITPKNRGKQIPKPRSKARQRENTKSRTETIGPPLPALLTTPINDAATDGLAGSGSHVLGHLPTSEEVTGYDSRTGMHSRAKSRKRKGRPSSPLRADNRNSDPAEDSAPALAGPSKKRRLVLQADEHPVGDSTGGPSDISRMETSVSALAAHARDDAATERVFDPLTVREPARRLNTRVYRSRAASERRARSKTKPAAGTAETAAAVAEPAAPGRSGIQPRSIAGSSRTRARDSPPPQGQDMTKSKRSRK